jgi:glycosyltransferase involved in cell wall biosynthesis
MAKRVSIAAVGDVTDVNTWSGIPYHFWRAASASGFAPAAWRLDLSKITWQRYVWNAFGFLRGGRGGFQYSPWFLDLAERQIPRELFATEVITFNQHFPRAGSVKSAGGRLNYYIDAPFLALVTGRGLDLRLPRRVVERAAAAERENYTLAERVITMGRWAAEVVVGECGVAREKVFTVLPGANVDLPAGFDFSTPAGRPGVDRDFVLGFVGKGWQRKGLPLLVEIRGELTRRGWKAAVHAAGEAPDDFGRQAGVRFVGFINKRTEAGKFVEFLVGCDVGCLFSRREALGISTLEFLRAGVPVAGFAHEGVADTIPPDAGFRFELSASARDIADRLEEYLRDELAQLAMRRNARRWSELVTWERCVGEFQELWNTGTVAAPVRPWLGLPAGGQGDGTGASAH